MKDNNCIFCKLANGDIPTTTIFEDEDFRVIPDAGPASFGHLLIIPKEHYANVGDDVPEELLGHVLATVKKIAEIKGLTECGYRCLINTGDDASQSVKHFHVHVLGGGHMPRPNDQDWGPAATNADKMASLHALLDAAKAYAAEAAKDDEAE